jgi:uncharacterized membrane protein
VEARGLIQGLYFSTPQLLWLIPVLLVAGLVYMRTRGGSRLLLASRMIVFSLIIVAAANPYFVETHTVRSVSPSITILDDQTGSMEVFDPDVAARLSQVLRGSQVRSFSGDATPLGDKIIQNSLPGETLVLVSDGQNNQGRPLDEALTLARASNTTVFAIDQQPIAGDSSVTIEGTNTAVLGGDYPFTVVVRSSDSYQGTLSVFADETLIYTDSIAGNGTSSIKISHAFLETGTHVLRASINMAPDRLQVNNNYQKAVYVVPQPDVLLVSGESDGPSPLATVMQNLYKLTTAPSLPSDLKGYKAIVIDNQRYKNDFDRLNEYVRDGGGLVVVGGSNSYELGGYLNSTLEDVLPVRSAPSTFEGGKTAIVVLDISFSLMGTQTRDGTPLLDYEKALAIELLRSPDLQDYDVGLVVFGTQAYAVADPIPLARGRSVLEERIASLSPSGTENTFLDNGLRLAWDMLNASGGQGELIVFSDGNLWNYQDVFDSSVQLLRDMNTSTRLFQVQAFPGKTGRLDEMAAQTGAEFVSFVYPTSLTTKVETPPERPPAEEKPPEGYSVSVVNENHYITSGLELNASITGFNDVTPKLGSQRLLAMADGKPVLTTWRYGLGRVAALSTDDGNTWASQLYAAPNSKVISSTINWAVGDPRPEEDRVEAEDGWLGTPLMITISSNARPSVNGASVEKVGDQRYVATLTPDQTGIYYIGDYGIAVNYPLEYRDLGTNPELSRLIMAHGGKVFTEDEARTSLIAEASRLSQRTVQERISQRDLLLLAALAIFLAEVVGRRIQEIRRRGRSRRKEA